METISCIIVGDCGVGKTSMLMTLVANRYCHDYEPTIHDSYTTTIEHNQKLYQLRLLDTSGQDAYDRLRRLMYRQCDVIVICYSVISPQSFHNVASKWIGEAKCYKRKAPVVLVAMQTDRRNDINTAKKKLLPITVTQGIELAREIHATEFIECSAIQKESLELIFDAVIYAYQKRKCNAKQRCVIS